MLHELIALLEGRALNSLLVLDMKGELAELLTDHALPMIASKLPAQEADAFLRRIVVIDPFSPTHLPPLNVLVRDPGLPIAIQARDVAECFEAATESSVTSRMETILDWVLRLVIEFGGSFHAVRRALQEPAVLEGLVRESKDADTIRYFVMRFPVEPKASKFALLARLDRFLAFRPRRSSRWVPRSPSTSTSSSGTASSSCRSGVRRRGCSPSRGSSRW